MTPLDSVRSDSPARRHPRQTFECHAMNHRSHAWLLNRRHLLRGAGVAMALPLLDCMRPLRAEPQRERAKRSVFMYLPNGVNTLDYQITQPGADYTLSRSLQPLARHRANFTPISGLYH